MAESRAIISDINGTRKKIEQLGAIYKGEYVFKDVIFIPQKADFNLNDDFLRLRIYTKNNWPTKNFVLVRKQRSELPKIGSSVFKKEFAAEKEALEFIDKEFSSEFKRGFEFSRTGWQYNLDNDHLFVEAVENFKPMIEIETESEQKLKLLFDKIGIVEKLTESMPEIMRRIKMA
jgi:adenylate cyclase class IV